MRLSDPVPFAPRWPLLALATLLIILLAAATLLWSSAGPAGAQDAHQPDPQLVDDVWDYARETDNGSDHVLRWMRVLHTFGALEDMTAAEAQDHADQFWAPRWDPVVSELTNLEAQDDYTPDTQVVDDVRGYSAETQNGFDHVLRWMRVLHTFDAFDDVTLAEAQDYAGQYWAARWDPVVAELTNLEAQDGYQPGQHVIDDVWTYAAETQNGFDHVLRWMRTLHTFGALNDVTAAEAQGYADQYLAVRWDPVVTELTQLEAQDGYQPGQQVIDDVWTYAAETEEGSAHVLRWIRVLHTFGALEDMTPAEARGHSARYWADRWAPVVSELTNLEAQDRYQPGQQVVDDAWGYARETISEFGHVLRWMRALHTLGALDDMTAAEAQGYADQYLAARWNPVVTELKKLEEEDGYQPDQQVIDDVWEYAAETENGFDHVLRWIRALHTFGALDGMTVAEGQRYADPDWPRWEPVAAELAEMEAAAAANPDPTPEPTPNPTPEPTPDPTPEPTPDPTPEPTRGPASAPEQSVPGTPANFAVSATAGSLDLSAAWDALDGAESYKLAWRQDGGQFEDANAATVTANSATITVSGYGRWVVRLEGCNDAGCGAAVTAQADAAPAPQIAPLQVSISVSPANPRVDEAAQLKAVISNPPEGETPSYAWEIDANGQWQSHGSNAAAVSYSASQPESRTFRVTVSYGSGASAMSDPLTVTWTEGWARQGISGDDGATGQQSNTNTTLVSNTGQADDRTNPFTRDYAQMFKTGTNADGYKLTSVVLEMLSTATTGPTYTVTIHDRQGIFPPREPTTNLQGTLTNPATLPGTFGEVVFTASGDGIALDPNTDYWMVIDVSTGDDTTKVASTTSKDEDSGAATGWSIIDSHNFRSNDSSSWSQASTDRVLQLAVRGTVTDTTPPEFSSAVVTDSALTVTFNENLDTGSVPAPGDFNVTIGDSRRNVADGGVAIADATVTLTLESAVVRSDLVKISYTKGANPLQDVAAGNAVETFTDQDVTNNTQDPPLVSNTEQAAAGNAGFYNDHAQRFFTGSNPDGYKLTSVVFQLASTASKPPTYTVNIRKGAFQPDMSTEGDLGTLTTLTDTLPGTAEDVVFSASGDGIALDPGGSYWVVIDVTSSEDDGNPGPIDNATTAARAGSTDEDAGGAAGWTISDDRWYRSNNTPTGWTAETANVLKLEIRGSVTDTSPPAFSSAAVNGSALRMTFNEDLDPDSVPAAGDFHVTVGTERRSVAPGTVDIFGKVLTLALASAVINADTVKVRYAQGANPLQDPLGNQLANFGDQEVTNRTGSTAPKPLVFRISGCSLSTCPDAPSGSADGGPGEGQITVNWMPASTGGEAETWRIDWRRSGSSQLISIPINNASARSHTITGLGNITEYDILVRGVISTPVGTFTGDAAQASNILAAPSPPVFKGAAVNGSTLTATFSEDLDAGSVPEPGDFHVTVGGSRRNVASGGVSISGPTVTLTLASAVTRDDTVQVRYTKGENPIQDAVGNPLATFANQAVINTTGSAVSNVGQASAPNIVNADYAQAFTTGSHRRGYTLSSLDLFMQRGTVPAAYDGVGIHADEAGIPGASVGELSTPGNLPGDKGAVPLTASGGGIPLEPDTTYWLVIDVVNVSSNAGLFTTPSDAEDAGAATGWSIADGFRTRIVSDTGNTWPNTHDDSIQLAIYAAETPPLVSNVNTGGSDLPVKLIIDHAQAFTTGSHNQGPGYRLTGVDLIMRQISASPVNPSYVNEVTIHRNASGLPGAEVGALTTSDDPPSAKGRVSFTASGDGIELDAKKKYWLVVDVDNSQTNSDLYFTWADSQDTGSAAGWSIADESRNRPIGDTDWNGSSTHATSMQLAIYASPIVDTTPPEFSSAAVDGAALTLTFNENLDNRSVPAPGDFFVTVGDSRRNVANGGVAIADATVTLTLAAAVAWGDAVKVRYTKPSSNPLQDVGSGNDVETFTDQDVTNITQDPALVGNIAQTADGTASFGNDHVQEFETGSNPEGYKLTSVVFRLASTASTPPTFTVSIHDGLVPPQNTTTNLLGMLTNPEMLPGTAGDVVFDALGDGIELDANASYYVLIDVSDIPDGTKGIDTKADRAGSTDEDAGGAEGWAIEDTRWWRTYNVSGWNEETANVLKLELRGTVTDTTPPAFSSAAVNGSALRVTFSEDLDPGSVPAAGDFHVTVGTERRNVVPGSVDISGKVVTLALASAVTETDTVQVRYTQGANPLRDPFGNQVATFGDQEVTNSTGSTAPVPLANIGQGCQACPNAPSGSADGGPDDGQITVNWTPAATGGAATGWIASRRVSGTGSFQEDPAINDASARSHTFTDLDGTKSYEVRVQALSSSGRGDIGQALGVPAAPTPPVFKDATVNGATLAVTFSENLDIGSVPAPGDFHVTVGGSRRNVTSGGVSISGPTVSLTLESAVVRGEAVQMRYTKGANPLQDTVGNPVATFADQTVANNTLDPTLIGNTGQTAAGAASFGNDHAQAFETGGNDEGYRLTSVVLRLASTAATAPDYTVSIYSDATNEPGNALGTLENPGTLPGAAGDAVFLARGDGIQLRADRSHWVVIDVSAGDGSTTAARTSSTDEDTGGAEGFSIIDSRLFRGKDATLWKSETNNFLKLEVHGHPTPDTTPPAFASAAVDGRMVTVVFNESLDEASTPARGDFFVTVGGSRRNVASGGVSISGAMVVLRLESAAAATDTVRVRYTQSASGSKLQDPAGNPVANFGNRAVINTTGSAVSNAGQTHVTLPRPRQLAGDVAQAFTTGSRPGGYALSRVDVFMQRGTLIPSYHKVGIYEDAGGVPGAEVGGGLTITTPLPVTKGAAPFEAPDEGIDLDPNTTYWLVIDINNPTNTLVFSTFSGAEDAGAATGWSIADGFRARVVDNTGNAWSTVFDDSIQLAIYAAENPPLVSNTGRAAAGTAGFFNDHAQAFTTGNHHEGYLLDGVSLRLASSAGTPPTYTVSIHANTSDNEPDTSTEGSKGTLTNPGALPGAAADVGFLAPAAGIELEDNTTYWMLLDVSSGDASTTVARTGSNAEDPGGAAGFSIANNRLWRSNGDTAWDDPEWANVLKLAVFGSPVVDTAPPEFSSAVVNGATLTMTFEEILDEASTPAPGDFFVTVGGIRRNVVSGGVDISGATVALTLASAVAPGDAVQVRYAKPGSNPLRDPSGNQAAALGDQAATNTTGSVVSNAGQTEVEVRVGADFAQSFTTGSYAGGYTLSSLEVLMRNDGATDPTYTVAIHADAAGVPGASVGALTKQGDPGSARGIVKFTADSPGIELEADTTYWLVLDFTGMFTDVWLFGTTSDDEDDDAAAGWSIGDSHTWRTPTTDPWSKTDLVNVLKMVIYASPVPPLVSNSEQPGDVEFGLVGDYAQAFTTGSNADGYLLTHVSAVMRYDGGVIPRYAAVGIHKDASGVPGVSVGTLAKQGDPGSARGPVVFAASGDGIYLNAETKYWFVIDLFGVLPLTKLFFTSSDAEDAGAAAGWSIADDSRWRGVRATSWTNPDDAFIDSDSMQITIHGSEGGPPTVSNAGLTVTSLTVRFNREMDPASEPAGSAFTVKVDGTAVTLASGDAVAIDGEVVTLTLASAVTSGTVTLDYTKPAINPLRSAAGAAAESFADQPVQTGNTAPVYTAPTDPNDNIIEMDALPRHSTDTSPKRTVVSLPTDQFSDGDGDELTYTVSGSRDDVYGEFRLQADNVYLRTWTGCVLEGLDPAVGDSPYDFVVTVKATDPYGASAKGTLTFRVSFECPALTSAVVNGSVLTLGYDDDLYAARFSPADFAVTVDGSPAPLAWGYPLSADEGTDVVTLTLAEPVTAGQSVRVSHTPVPNPFGPMMVTVTDFDALNTTGSAVSNAAQVDNERDLAKDFAQAFTTGSHPGGYTLSRLELLMRAGASAPAYTGVGIHANNAGVPGASVGALSTPGAPPNAKGAVPLTASGAAIQLDPNTTYWLVLDVSATSDAKLFHTSSDAEDEGKAQDWSIADTSRNRAFGDTTWTGTADDDSLQLVIFATPNPTTVLVGNYGQPDGGDATLDNDHAQAFRTGDYGNRLTQVDLEMLLSSGTEPTYTVKVHSNSGSEPGGELEELTKQDTPTATAAKVRFTADGDGLELAANTTYWIVVDVSSGPSSTASLGRTGGKGEDAGKATGWSIANKRLARSSTTTAWASQNANVLKIAVHGNTTPAEVSSAAVNGATLTVGFDYDLDETSTPAPDDLQVTVGTAQRNVVPGGVSISGPIVFLTLESAVSATGTDPVRVAYTRPDANPLRDAAGYPVATFADRDVTRNVLVSSLAQPQTANVLGYAQYDAAQSFTTGGTTRYTLTGVQLDVGVAAPANTVEPTYSVSIHADSSGEPGDSLDELTKPETLADGVNTFTAPDNGINLLTDTTYWVVVDVSTPAGDRQVSHRFTSSASEDAGVSPVWTIADTVSFRQFDAADLTWTSDDGSLKMAVLGRVTDATPPAFSSARVNGVRLKVTFDEDLDPNSAPAGSAFQIFGVAPEIAGTGTAVIDGKTVTVILERAVPANRTVSVSYLIPDQNPLQDAVGNAVPGFGPNPMTNNSNTTPPAFVSATFKIILPEMDDSEPNGCTVTGNGDLNELTVIFNEELNPAFAPAGSAFTLRDRGGSLVIAGIGTAVIDGNKVTVMLAEAPDLYTLWRLSYVRPSESGLRDYTGRLAHNFSNRPATYKPSGKTVECGPGDDSPGDTLGDDTLNGGPGNDGLFANSGDDVLNGGPGNDRLYGDAHGSGAVGNDTLNGGPGHDYLVGGPGADNLDGGKPNYPDDAADFDYHNTKMNYYESVSDWFLPGDTASYWWSLAGVTVNLSASSDELRRAGCVEGGYDGIGKGGNAEGDCLTGIENIVGSEHRDNLMGSAGPNLLRGGDDADTLDGYDGHEKDAVDYRDSNAPVKVDLYVGGGETAPYGKGYCNINSSPRRCGFAGNDTIRNIRTVHGSNHYDVIIGDDNDNTLYGHKGDDKLKGEGGADTLYGGVGNDNFYFFAGRTAMDIIGDYASGDSIILCMGTASNLPTWTSADNGSDHDIIVTFNGNQEGTIRLANRSTNTSSLNITAFASTHSSCVLR